MQTLDRQVVDCARSWIGTRFRHQGRSRSGGDCLGLLVMVAKECELEYGGQFLSDYDESDYGIFPDIEKLQAKLAQYLMPLPLANIRMGDVVLFSIDHRAQHLGLVCDYHDGLGMIHAYAPARSVVEHRLEKEWLSKGVAAFRFMSSA